MSESDLILKQNEQLRQKNKELLHSEKKTREEAEATVTAVRKKATEDIQAMKRECDSKEAELSRRELDIIGNENQVAYKQVNIDAGIKSKAENMIADRKFALEKDMQNRSAKLEQMYKARTCDLQAKYKKMTVGYRSMVFFTLFYGVATTIIGLLIVEGVK